MRPVGHKVDKVGSNGRIRVEDETGVIYFRRSALHFSISEALYPQFFFWGIDSLLITGASERH